MQSFDVVVLGAGVTGTRIAVGLRRQGLTAALVALPDDEDYLHQLLDAISFRPGIPAQKPAAPAEMTRIQSKTYPRFIDERHLSVDDEKFHFNFAVIAAGCSARAVPQARNPVTPIDFFRSPSNPSPVNVWGAGPSGVCAAIKIANRGGQAKLISRHDRVLPYEDETTAGFATRELQRAGVRIVRETEVTSAENFDVLCAGLLPRSKELSLPAAYIYADPASARVKTDELMRTSNPRVYAAGAVTGPPFHLNFERFQADLIIENVTASVFMKHRCMPESFPSVIPFSAPLARVGLTEAESRARFKDAAAVTQPAGDGFVKLIALKRSGLLAGAHAAGSGAEELILFFDLMMRAEITVRDISERHHFPSSPLSDATADAVGRWIEIAGR